jgi:hypothetical protein
MNTTLTYHMLKINSLAKRTGISAFAFFSKTHVNDSVKPYWASTPGALQFLPEALQTSSGEVGRKFELWSVTKGDSKILFLMSKLYLPYFVFSRVIEE